MACGHVEITWPLVKALGKNFPHGEVWCKDCDAWIAVTRPATTGEIVGITLAPAATLSDDSFPF